MSDDTAADETVGVVDPTEAIEPEATTALAWSSDQADDEELTHPAAVAGANRPVVAVAALAGVALALASVAAVVALMTPHREPDRFLIRPAPVEQVPPPAPPKAPPPPAQPPAQAAPPVRQAPPPQAPPNAQQQFTQALRGDKPETQGGNGLYPTQSAGAINSEAQAMCRDLANGGSVQPYIDGTLQKSPSLAPWQAALVVHQAIESFCPQYNR